MIQDTGAAFSKSHQDDSSSNSSGEPTQRRRPLLPLGNSAINAACAKRDSPSKASARCGSHSSRYSTMTKATTKVKSHHTSKTRKSNSSNTVTSATHHNVTVGSNAKPPQVSVLFAAASRPLPATQDTVGRIIHTLWNSVVCAHPRFLRKHLPSSAAVVTTTGAGAAYAGNPFQNRSTLPQSIDPPANFSQLVAYYYLRSVDMEPFAFVMAIVYLERLALAAELHYQRNSSCQEGALLPDPSSSSSSEPFLLTEHQTTRTLIALVCLGHKIHGDVHFTHRFFLTLAPEVLTRYSTKRQQLFTPITAAALVGIERHVLATLQCNLFCHAEDVIRLLQRYLTSDEVDFMRHLLHHTN